MPHQLEFWTTEQHAPVMAPLWKDLDAEVRAAMIDVLARMITKAVYPQIRHEEEEKEHER
ncbi:MAG: hypothetical protein GXY55_20350 [Phycisphaerae bacterium]|nr:hypothetical protein [Phycisphaerae bacterium]